APRKVAEDVGLGERHGQRLDQFSGVGEVTRVPRSVTLVPRKLGLKRGCLGRAREVAGVPQQVLRLGQYVCASRRRDPKRLPVVEKKPWPLAIFGGDEVERGAVVASRARERIERHRAVAG